MFDLADILIYGSAALVASCSFTSFCSHSPPPVPVPVAPPVLPTAIPPALDWLGLYLDALEVASPSFLHHHLPAIEAFPTVDYEVVAFEDGGRSLASSPTISPPFACGEHFMCPDVVALAVVPSSWSWSPDMAYAFTVSLDLAVLSVALILLSGLLLLSVGVDDAKYDMELDWAVVIYFPPNAAARPEFLGEFWLPHMVKDVISLLRTFRPVPCHGHGLDEITGALVLYESIRPVKDSTGELVQPPLDGITGAMVLYRPLVNASPIVLSKEDTSACDRDMELLPPRVQILAAKALRVSERVRSRTGPFDPPTAQPVLPHFVDMPVPSFGAETAPAESHAINLISRVGRVRTMTCNVVTSEPRSSSRPRTKTAPGQLFRIPAAPTPVGTTHMLALPDLKMPLLPPMLPETSAHSPLAPLTCGIIYRTTQIPLPPPAPAAPPTAARIPLHSNFMTVRPSIIGGEHFDRSFGLLAKKRQRNNAL